MTDPDMDITAYWFVLLIKDTATQEHYSITFVCPPNSLVPQPGTQIVETIKELMGGDKWFAVMGPESHLAEFLDG